VPLHAEEISISKEKLETGRVQVSTVTRDHEQLVDELLTNEHVEIDRIPIGKAIDARPDVREEADSIIVPVVEEVLVLERRLILKEEVHIRRVRGTERHQERVKLRKQEALVTRVPIEAQDKESSSISEDRTKNTIEEKRYNGL
jgi:uncharacterized protein (TIGR02271 family)